MKTGGRVKGKPPTRAYDRAFRPEDGTGREFKISRIPVAFWERVQDRARSEGVSLRSLILTALREWVDAPPVPPPLALRQKPPVARTRRPARR
jgi:hypothetical protein